MVSKGRPTPQSMLVRYRQVFTVLVALLDVLAIVFLYKVSFSPLARWAAALVLLIGSGDFIARINGKQHFLGMYMLGGSLGIKFVDRLSKKNVSFWNYLADWGLVLGFGILAWPLFKKHIDKQTFFAGMSTILVLLFLIYPYLGLTLNFLNIPAITGRISLPPPGSTVQYSLTPQGALLFGFAIVGGFTLFTIAGVAYNGVNVLYSALVTSYHVVVQHNVTNNTIAQQIPGVAPLIPGITIPLLAGIIALALLLVIHEFSHGVLARISKIKIKQIGLVLFGIIPAGAFVEPNEAAVKRLGEKERNRIFIAGVSSNMLAAIVFAVLFILFYSYILPSLLTVGIKVVVVGTVPGSAAYNVIPINATILDWNGYPIANISSFKVAAANDTAYRNISVVTNTGSYLLRANATGKVGVYVSEVVVQEPKTPGIAYSIINFLYEVVSLSFLLNFLVGVVNMLPLPGLDGWRVYQTKIKDKRVLNAIVWVIVILIVLNVLPWLFVQ